MPVHVEKYLPCCRLIRPETQRAPVVFDSPHSGTTCPADFDFACKAEDIERTVDHFVDALFSFAPEEGMPLLTADFYRAYIDLNRAPDEIDPSMLSSPWPEKACQSAHVKSGAGLIRKYCLSEEYQAVPIYDQRLTVKEVQARITNYYMPYHDQLEKLLDQTKNQFGAVWHINCHSMPSRNQVVMPGRQGVFRRLPDFVLGDYSGTSCAPDFTRFVRKVLEDLGYSVAINTPYKGVELVRRYSAPALGRHSLQLEINRDLYMDEACFERLPKSFVRLQTDLQKLACAISDYAAGQRALMAAE